MNKKKQKQRTRHSTPRRQRRGLEEQIAALEAKIAAVKERQARKEARADPTVRHVNAALRSIAKALASTGETSVTRTLSSVRSSLESLLARGPALGSARSRRDDDLQSFQEALFAYVRSNPRQRGEQIAAALGTDTATMRPVMRGLIEDGRIKTEGQRRGMTYEAV